MKVLGAGRIL